MNVFQTIGPISAGSGEPGSPSWRECSSPEEAGCLEARLTGVQQTGTLNASQLSTETFLVISTSTHH
ncbi:unnamed protein product [Protopolystoma xenopodis]|uniref:Uncharacterized protein n=1 Tax=Protopolystoma xenopodis TaxID=117903 RepID=A0A3S5A0E7_9PLAT|nr:unnamed protein product [Protopolystoma xenopodis]